MSNSRVASTSTPINPVLANRWSPRSFDSNQPLTDEEFTAIFEAARWSPSANNSQPWRFIAARHGTQEFEKISSNLASFNQAWAPTASLLVVGIAEMFDENGNKRSHAIYDLGQSVAHLSVQAHSLGLHVHQMSGFSPDGIRSSFAIEERFNPKTVFVVGHLGNISTLPKVLAEREVAPRVRKPFEELFLS